MIMFFAVQMMSLTSSVMLELTNETPICSLDYQLLLSFIFIKVECIFVLDGICGRCGGPIEDIG